MNAPDRTCQRGFTLLEMSLALTVGSMAMLLAGGIFYSVGRVDESSERSHRVRSESYIVQTVLRNTFMNLLVVQGNAQDSQNPPDITELGRPRILLEMDAVTEGAFQRLEIVLRSTPVPDMLQGPAARLAFMDEDAASLNFASADGAGGSARCVFEMRPDGEREAVMRSLGIENPMTDKAQTPPGADGQQGWSLWWRRMTADEVDILDAGYLPWADGQAEPNFEARRLASSVRLASGLRDCVWKFYHRAERKEQFTGFTSGDLPAYAEIEFADLGAEYSNWMFEIGWAYGEPEDITLAQNDEDTGRDNAPGGTTGSGMSDTPRRPNRGPNVELLYREERPAP